MRGGVPIEPLSAHALDDVAEQKEIDVAVDEPLAGPRDRHFLDRAPHGFLLAVELRVQLQIGTQPRRVRHQVANRDGALAVPRELGNELRHRIAQPDGALLHQLHHARRRRDDFRQRREIENGVLRHRLRRGEDRALTERARIQNCLASSDENDGAGELVGGDCLAHEPFDRRESLRLGRGGL